MSFLLTLALLILPQCLFSLSIPLLLQKMEEPLPQWMQKQIENDLQPFHSQGASHEAIDKTLEALFAGPRPEGAHLVIYEICNNTLTCSSLGEDPNDARISHFTAFFQEIAQVLSFPDVKILASLWDHFDSSLYLRMCKSAIFSICKRHTNSQVILWPEVTNQGYYEGIRQSLVQSQHQYPWETRKEIAYWRGNTTGYYYHYHEWEFKPRPQLVLFSKEHPDLVDARFSGDYYLEYHVKETFKTLDFFDAWLYPTAQLGYKYQMTIDGNSFPSSFKWQLLSRSTILKNTSDFIEWFYSGLTPGVHYLNYHTDCSDLAEQIQWLRDHDSEAKTIADNAFHFAIQYLSYEEIARYYYHLICEFAKLQTYQNSKSKL